MASMHALRARHAERSHGGERSRGGVCPATPGCATSAVPAQSPLCVPGDAGTAAAGPGSRRVRGGACAAAGLCANTLICFLSCLAFQGNWLHLKPL